VPRWHFPESQNHVTITSVLYLTLGTFPRQGKAVAGAAAPAGMPYPLHESRRFPRPRKFRKIFSRRSRFGGEEKSVLGYY
jgi:hypothetical protein